MTIAEQLIAAGMSEQAAREKQRLFARIDATHRPSPGAAHRFWVPGRIEVLGKHTDYAGGRSLLCAVERGFCVIATRRDDARVEVGDALSGERATATLTASDRPVAGHWSNYVTTVARRLARDFAPLRGAGITFASDLPIAAGVSSSSALVVALALSIIAANEVDARGEYRWAVRDDDALAGYLGAVENGLPFGTLPGDHGVGTFGGSEDHTAILRARVGAVAQYRFCPVGFERTVPLPPHHSFLIVSSGVRAEKTGAALAAYNSLSMLARTALERWNAVSGRTDASLGQAVAACGADVVRLLGGESPELAERVEQFYVETESIIPGCADALERRDLTTFGALVERSMHNAERMLHNQVPETVFLAARARELGAVAASAFGAGFGGSVWALAHDGQMTHLMNTLRRDYEAAFPHHAPAAEFFQTPAGPAAQSLAAG